MSDSSTPAETSSSGEQEPTMVSVPVVGSSATDNMSSSWDNGAPLSVHESSDICNISPLCNDVISTSSASAVSLTSASQMSRAITYAGVISHDTNNSTNFMHSGMVHDADSTSGSIGICEEEQMIVDGMSVHTIVSQEALSVSQDSDNSNDHISVMDNIAAQNFLHETDLLNAATSALHHEKSSPEDDEDMDKSNISHNLMSSLDHQSVSSSHEPEAMEMQSLLREQHDLDGPVSSMTEYHLDHSQTSELSVGSTSQLDIGVGLSGGMRADGICLSPSSTSSTSSLDLPSGTCISSGIGLPPVSTIIRSSVAKGRFDVFCRPSNNMILGIPFNLNSSGSYDVMTSMGAIQRMATGPCDGLTAVSLASPLEVSSSRHNTCTNIAMENVDVPLSSSLVCSSTSSGHNATVVGSGCIKPTSSVMSTLGPHIIGKQSSLSEMAESRMQSDENLNLTLTSAGSIPSYAGVIPIRQMISLGGSPSQVSLQLSPMRIEEIQRVAAISEHLRSETPVSTTYTLCGNDDSLSHSMISSHFNCRDDMQQTDSFSGDLSQTSQSLPLLSVSAIETNVIMSTSNIDSAMKLSNAEIKVIETSQRLRDQQLQNLQNMNHRLEKSNIESQIIPENVECSRNSDIIYSTVQNMFSNHDVDTTAVFTSSAKTLYTQNLVSSRSSIIERNTTQQSQASVKSEPSVITTLDGGIVQSGRISAPLQRENSNSVSMKSPKFEERILLEESGRTSLSNMSPSAVTASVIQQLLKAQASPVKLKRTPGGVITSAISVKEEPTIVQRESNYMTTSVSQEALNVKAELRESLSNLPITTVDNSHRTLLVNVTGSGKSPNVTIHLPDESLDNQKDKSPSTLSPSLETDKESSSLPSLASVALPSIFSSLSASAMAALQSSLSSGLPLTLPTSLPNACIGGTATTISLLSSMQSGLVSPPISAVSSILLPSILTSPLRNVASTIKSPTVDALSASNGMPCNNASIYSGLLKSVGLSTVVKQEHSGSGPLPPFTVVSGLSPLVKRDFNATLASTFLSANHISSQIPVVTIKQEPGVTRSSASASEFTSTILNAGSSLPNVTSVHIPSATQVELAVVVASSATAATVPTITSPVPSQASTIAFAGNALPVISSVSTVLSTSSIKEEKAADKKWNCPMCKNGSPCGLHPTQSQGSSSASQTTPPPPLMSGDPAKPFQCTLCGKHLASKNVYQLHLRSHSGEKPFTCNLCGHHFSQKTSLTRHMRSHTGERPFPCEVCGKRFADKERIKIHMRTHTGEKPFACEVCGKRFSQKSTVKRHMSVHTGEKPFKCEACGKGFANRGNLNAHSKTHANT